MTTILHLGKRYVVYADKAEAERAGERVMPVDEAEVGDYVETRSGHYIPVTGKSYWKGSRGDGGIDRVLLYPGGKHYIFKIKTTDVRQVTWDAKFWLNVEKPLDSWKIYAAELMARGMETYKAIEKALGGNTIVPVATLARRLLTDKLFINYLFNETEGNVGLRESLKQRGADDDFLADKIMELVNADKVPANLRQWALQSIKEALNDKKPLPSITNNTQINQYNAPALAAGEQRMSVLDQLKQISTSVVEVPITPDSTHGT
jgi:hypothetical protein